MVAKHGIESVKASLQRNCFRARRTGNGQNADGRRGVRGAALEHSGYGAMVTK